ncbi:PREDICTED: sperm flagellar protein 1-like [Priapulus caudatus]|uniref:Sperm flagellar protein 1-like n=1 Tax=Priapulus caudatus TaxID=37621 RepID=A0ABM1E671_PRICU|nr:PREDICTED: sperm flagellar protein 1-like [Priapulus caudatus]
MSQVVDLDEELLDNLYTWIDKVPLSRVKRNLARDFSDGVLAAEVVKFFFPRLVEIHNYVSANSVNQKVDNWNTLNRKVLSKINFNVTPDVINQIVNCKPSAIECVLSNLRTKIDIALWNNRKKEVNDELPDYLPKQDMCKCSAPLVDEPKVGIDGKIDSQGQGTISYNVQRENSYSKIPPKVITVGKEGQKVQKYVPIILLEEKEQEVLLKDETIQILQAKVRRQEHLIHLKDIRIEDLTNRIEQMRPTKISRGKVVNNK